MPPLNGSDRDDITPLVGAVMQGNFDVVETLLKAKADPEGGRVPQPLPEELEEKSAKEEEEEPEEESSESEEERPTSASLDLMSMEDQLKLAMQKMKETKAKQAKAAAEAAAKAEAEAEAERNRVPKAVNHDRLRSPLILAVQLGNRDMAERLLEYKADPNNDTHTCADEME